jgi:hypothetical protein
MMLRSYRVYNSYGERSEYFLDKKREKVSEHPKKKKKGILHHGFLEMKKSSG